MYAATLVGSVNGGGQIYQAPSEDAKRPEWNVISFGGWFNKYEGGIYEGEWQINFHNVGRDEFDKTTFHSTDIQNANFSHGNNTSCYEAMNMTAVGSWNGMPGYKIIFRAGDFGSPGNADTVRVELYAPNGDLVYDTTWSWGEEFKNESNCVGTARTGLDAGNITIFYP